MKGKGKGDGGGNGEGTNTFTVPPASEPAKLYQLPNLTVDGDLVRTLEWLLAEARKGELVAALVCFTKSRSFVTVKPVGNVLEDDGMLMLGAISRLQHAVQKTMDEIERPV